MALRIVSVGLVADQGWHLVGFSIRHLSDHQAADGSVAAIVLASASLVVLALLAYGKRVIGTTAPQPCPVTGRRSAHRGRSRARGGDASAGPPQPSS